MEPDIAANAGKELEQPAALNVGMTLREAREHLGLSVHDVAERIKFAPKQVEALEANDFAHLPEAAFLRGFVRSYARMLQLDEAVLIAALPVELSRQADTKAQTVEVAFPAIQSLRRANLMWLVGALVVALALGLFVLLHEEERTVKPAETVVEPVPLPAPEAAVSAVVNTEEQPQTAEVAKAVGPEEAAAVAKVAEPQKKAEVATVAVPNKVPEAVAKQPAAAPLPQIAAESAPAATAKPPVPLEILKRRPLHFVFSETAWAEVIDVNGAILLSRTNPRGSEQWVGGPRRAPYDVTIAHPGTVKLYYKGKEIDLSAYAGAEVAHLKVE